MAKSENPTTKFKVDISELKSGIQEANRLIRLANSEFKAASSGMDDWSKSTDGLSAKIKSLTTVQELENKKLDNLKEQYKLVVAEQGENSKGAQDLAIKINNQQAAVNNVTNELSQYTQRLDNVKQAEKLAADSGKDFEDALREIEGAADDAGAAAEDSGDGYTVLKDVIADLAVKAIGAAIQGFKDLAFEGENALDLLQAKTGATSSDMAGLSDVAYDIFNNGWGQSIDEVTEALATVKQMTDDLDNASLQKITENTMTLSDVFGWDVKESMRAANSLMDQFGITSDEAFNLMAQGAQNGLDQNDDLLDTINEYSVQFANAGFSADDMFNMLNNGAKSGTWSIDKLGDAVKEYNIRWTDGTAQEALSTLGFNADEMAKKMNAGGEESAKAMQAVMASLTGVEDEQQRYILGQQLMGTMWEDLGEDAVMALMNTNGEISKTNDAMGQVKTDAYDNLSTSLTTLGRTLKDEILKPIVDLIAPAVTSLVNFIVKHKDIVIPIVTGLAIAFGVLAGALAIQGLISGVTKAFALLNGTLMMNPIVLIVAAIAGLIAAFVMLWNKSEAFRQFWIKLWEAIKSAAKAAWDAISGFFSSAWNKAKSIWNAAGGFFSGIWSKIKSVFSSVVSFFSEKFKGAYNAIKNVFSGLYGFFSGVWNKITGLFKKVGTTVGNAIGGAVRGAINSVLSGAVRIINGFISAINAAISVINAIPGVKIGKLSSLSVPRLAKGGVVDGATLAVLGENGKEAIVPLENNLGWIKGIASNLAGELNDSASIGGANTIINNYAFNQTNNSPKALSRIDLYRQTKQQMKMLKEVGNV